MRNESLNAAISTFVDPAQAWACGRRREPRFRQEIQKYQPIPGVKWSFQAIKNGLFHATLEGGQRLQTPTSSLYAWRVDGATAASTWA